MSSGKEVSLTSIQKSHRRIIVRQPLRTDVKQRVLDPMKQPLPRFDIAGEISSIYGHLYLEAGNITECFAAGKIAGQNAAAEPVWE